MRFPQERRPAPAVPSMTAARRAVVEMVNGGVRHVVVCPGSRSAPLAYAIAEFEAAHPSLLTTHVRIDERSAAFFALGIALNTERPVAVVTTSGTAVGNLLPAAMEANHAAVPLVLVTADRPEELHGTGANQTTVQRGIFGEHVRFAVSVAAGEEPTAEVRQALTAALGVLTMEHSPNTGESNPVFTPDGIRAQNTAPGPVHINLCFRDPLTPIDNVIPQLPESAAPESDVEEELDVPEEDEAGDIGFLEERRSVVIAGHGAGPVAEHVASELGLPLLAEPSSSARFGNNAINAYRLLIPELVHQIDRVIVFGRPTLNREVAALLANKQVPSALYVPEPVSWFEAGKRTERIVDELDDLKLFAGRAPYGWLETWTSAAADALKMLQPLCAGLNGELTAHDVARTVWEHAHGNLIIGSSNIIRDIDITGAPHAAVHHLSGFRVFANRGLAGIDGTISTALGIAASSPDNVRTTVVLGDVTFLHDASALVQGALEQRLNLDIVVLNDHGGGIFSTLEHGRVGQRAEWADTVERFFGTPQQVNIAGIASGYGAEYDDAASVAHLESLLQRGPDGIRVIEANVSRNERSAQTAAMKKAIAELLGPHS